MRQAHQAHQKLSIQTDQLQDEVKRLCDVLQEKEQAIATLQAALADSELLITELQTPQTPEPAEPIEPLSESAQLTRAMITLTGVISQLSQQLSSPEKTTQNLTSSLSSQDLVNLSSKPSNLLKVNQATPKRSRSATSKRIEKAIALVIEHNLNSPLEDRWLISYTVLSDLLGTSLTPITTFFNDQANQQWVNAIAQHHQDLGINNNTHNRTYHPRQKITQFLKLPD